MTVEAKRKTAFGGTFEEAIDIFIEDGRVRELSPRTLAHYRMFLERFAEWCSMHGIGDVREVTLSHVLDFRKRLDRRKGPGGNPSSVTYRNRHVRAVRMLFRLLYKRELIISNLAVRIPEYKDPVKLPRGIMDKIQVKRLLQSAHMTTPTGFRDRTIFEVLYSTGIRGGELCELTLYDLDLPGRTLRVLQGKGRKDRVVPIGKVACSYLAEYIKTVRPILLACPEHSRRDATQTPTVFVTAQGAAFKTTNLRQQFMLHRDRAGLGDIYTVHSLRHTCATELLKGGANIRQVQELLGHADISTTQIYTHVVQSDLRKAHARTAPSERRQSVDVPTFPPKGDPDACRGDSPKITWNDNRNAKYWLQIRRSSPSEGGPAVHTGKAQKPAEKSRKVKAK